MLPKVTSTHLTAGCWIYHFVSECVGGERGIVSVCMLCSIQMSI